MYRMHLLTNSRRRKPPAWSELESILLYAPRRDAPQGARADGPASRPPLIGLSTIIREPPSNPPESPLTDPDISAHTRSRKLVRDSCLSAGPVRSSAAGHATRGRDRPHSGPEHRWRIRPIMFSCSDPMPTRGGGGHAHAPPCRGHNQRTLKILGHASHDSVAWRNTSFVLKCSELVFAKGRRGVILNLRELV
jgi:hypothetical protein